MSKRKLNTEQTIGLLIAVEWPSYGRPRMTKELRERGWAVNPKRVYRLMRGQPAVRAQAQVRRDYRF